MDGKLVSTRDIEKKEISYTDALLEGLAPDGGLYVPKTYPQLSKENLENLKNKTYQEVAYEIKKKLIGNFIPQENLKELIHNAYNKTTFNVNDNNIVPIKPIGDNIFLQNLSLGPTAAFKDMALQQLGQEINYELKKRNSKLVILGATSGDTGSSAEAAVKGLDKIKLFILSPQKGMSEFQKAQMGSLTGENIFNIGINARFDDCQDLVKELKQDPEFSKLGAINSINWGRITSQVPYFVSGYLQAVSNIGEETDFVVPTGNFGNILSGYIAKKMGLPIRRLIVATNENNVLSKLIRTGIYELTPAQITSSPSMDISKASNYERLVYELFNKDPQKVKEYMQEFAKNKKVDLKDFNLDKNIFKKEGFYEGTSSHQERIQTIKDLYNRTGTIIDPHTADGVVVAHKHKQKDNVPMIVMQTALPVKFEHTIKEALGFIPKRDERFKNLEKNVNENSFYNINPDSDKLKQYIRENI
jgi:threonine synthase